MKERPIIFSDEMVKAILDGKKTQTRRPIDPQPDKSLELVGISFVWDGKTQAEFETPAGYHTPLMYHPLCPYGQSGDRLWVRETFAVESSIEIADPIVYPPPFTDGRPIQWHDDPDYGKFWDQCHYKATDPAPELCYTDRDEPGVRWKPSIHMPRWASHITLEIVNVRVERLWEIRGPDCLAEGITIRPDGWDFLGTDFSTYWDTLYTKNPEYQWEANPWV